MAFETLVLTDMTSPLAATARTVRAFSISSFGVPSSPGKVIELNIYNRGICGTEGSVPITVLISGVEIIAQSWLN